MLNYSKKINNSVSLKIDLLLERTSLQSILLLCFTIFISFSLCLSAFTLYGKFSKTLSSTYSEKTKSLIEQANFSLHYYFTSMTDISNELCYKIVNYKDLNSDELSIYMETFCDSRKDLVTLSLFTDTGELISSSSKTSFKNVDVTNEPWFKNAKIHNKDMYYSNPHVQNLFANEYPWVFSNSRELSFTYNNKKYNGILLVDFNFNNIENICKKVDLGEKGYVYITDSNGNIIYHPKLQLINSNMIVENNKKYAEHNDGTYEESDSTKSKLTCVQTTTYAGWKIIGVSYMEELIKTRSDLINFTILILLWFIYVGILLASFISLKISKPIKILKNHMESVEDGNFDITVPSSGLKEVSLLSSSFNTMTKKIKELMNTILYEQEEKRKTELNALQYQINPHFLYNTLDSVVWLAENEDNEKVVTMITSLARLLRIGMSKGENIITVNDELEHVKNYLIIQKVRYKNKFDFSLNVDENVKDHKVLKLILQPIAENSILHGFDGIIHKGQLNITSKIQNNNLVFIIEDNGNGIPYPLVEKMNNTKDNLSGVGINNVKARISLYYGKEYGINIESELDEGTKVTITLPIQRGE